MVASPDANVWDIFAGGQRVLLMQLILECATNPKHEQVNARSQTLSRCAPWQQRPRCAADGVPCGRNRM